MSLPPPHDARACLQRLNEIFHAMDTAYDAAAAAYGFCCTGCDDNCCETRFYHHTLLEYLCLRDGVAALADSVRRSAREQALAVCRRMGEADRKGERLRVMCPLNVDGRCIVYAHRPMICRLHGIPHQLQRPGGQVAKGPGCGAFTAQCGRQGYVPFDRTPFYRRMAALEGELRQRAGVTEKIRKTVAEMVLEICRELSEGDHEIP